MVVSLGATLDEEKKISLSTGKPKYSGDFTKDLGVKYSIALGDQSPGPDVMANSILAGVEDRYRYLMHQKEVSRIENLRLGLIQEIAQNTDSPITSDTIDIVKGLSQAQLFDPNLDTILEEEYAKKATNYTASLMDEDTSVLKEAMQDNPDAALETLDRAQFATARLMIHNQMKEQVLEESKFKGIGDLPRHGLAWAQALLPFWQDLTISLAAPNAKVNSLLVGENLNRIINYMWRLPPAEFKKEYTRIRNDFMGRSDFLGLQRFINSMETYGTSDMAFDNALEGIDFLTSFPTLKLAHAMRGASKAAAGSLSDLTTASVRVGKDAEAAKSVIKQALTRKSITAVDPADNRTIELIVPTEARPHQVWTDTPKLTPAAVQRLEKAVKNQDDLVLQAMSEPNRIDTLDPNQLEAAFTRATRDLEDMFAHDRYSIVNVERTPADNVTNVNTVTIQFGKKNGEFFDSEKQAKNNAKWVGIKTDDYTLKPVPGGKWTVEVKRPVREDGLRGVEIETINQSPRNWTVNKFLGWLRTPDDKVSELQRQNRAQVVSSQEHLAGVMEGLARPIGKVSKKELKELSTALEYNRIPDKTTNKSRYFTKYSELEEFWQTRFGHLPTEKQYEAYRAIQHLSDLEWTVLNQDVLLQKIRLGIESFSFKLDGLDFPVPIEGKLVNQLPPINQESRAVYRVGIIQNGKITDEFTSRNPGFTIKKREKVDELTADGYRIINVSGSFTIGEKGYQYLVVRDFKRNTLDPNQLAYNPGHRIDKYSHYLKQPILRTDEDGTINYYGDRSYANVRSEAEGIELAKRFDIAREKLRTSAPDAEQYIRDNLPVSYKQLLDEIDRGIFDLNSPIKYTPAGHSTRSGLSVLDREKFNDFTGNEHNPSYQIKGKFIGESSDFDLPTYVVEKNTAKKFTGTRTLNPLEALQAGLDNAVQVRVMNDYRVKSTEDFVREFGHLLQGTSEEFRSGGIDFLYNPSYLKDANPVEVARAETVRKTITGLLNHKTFVERAVDVHKERIVNSIRGWAGNNVADFISDTAIPKIKNADVWIRSIGFHTKLGLFNPKQLFLQASTAVNVVFVSNQGIKAFQNSTQMMIAHQFAGNPERMAKIAQKAVGMTPEHFTEMVDAFRRSGFSRTGQNSYLDIASGPSIKTGKTKMILDLGARPFNMGEYYSRSMGWSAAYNEWRAANKGKQLTRQAEKTILARAQLLTGNMMRQSNAAWQKGYLSVVTQFFGAQARLTEQLLSGGLLGNGRLTRAEKARLFLAMSTLYGMPVGLGATVGVAPVRDMLRDWLAENNIQYDQTLAEPFIDGFASTLVEYLTGSDFTISEKYGLGGIPTIYDLMKGDSSLTELLMGASGGITYDTLADTQPFWSYLGSITDLDNQDYYPITAQELFDPLRNITTVNSIVRLMEASNIQKWMSRNGTILTDITDQEALISSIFGVDPERVSDTYNRSDAMSTWQKHETEQRRAIAKDLIKAIQAFKTDDDEVGDMLMVRSRKEAVKLGLDDRQFSQMLQDAIQQEGFDDLITEKWNKKVLEKTLKDQLNNG